MPLNAKKRKEQVSVITVALAAVTLFIYALITQPVAPAVFVQVSACALVPTVLLLTERFTQYALSVPLFAAITVHVILSSFCGSALGFYYAIPWWDLFLHGMFGVVAAAALVGLLRCRVKPMGAVLEAVVVFLSVMGLAALWEVGEYVTDLVMGGDAQRVLQALQNGGSPVGDTMTDIIITAVGVLAYAIITTLWRKIKKEQE